MADKIIQMMEDSNKVYPIGSICEKTLWQNTNTAADFVNQIVNIETGYKYIIIVVKHYKTSNATQSWWTIPNGDRYNLFSVGGTSAATVGNLQIQLRQAIVSNGSVQFTEAKYVNAAGSFTQDNGGCIPIKIIGIK